MTRLQIGTAIAAIIQALGLATATAQTTSTAVAASPDDPQAVEFFQQAKRLETSQDTAPLRRHLAEYIEMWGKRGGVDRLIAAHARLGELSWRAACPIPEWDGLCMSPRTSMPTAKEIPACGGPRQLTQYKLHDRQAPLVQAAMEQLSKALTLYRSGGAENQLPETEDPAARQRRIEAIGQLFQAFAEELYVLKTAGD